MNNKKISILHFSQVNGGVERYLKLFLKFSDSLIFENSIISPNKNNYESYSCYIKNFYEVNIGQSFSIYKLLKNVFLIRKIIKKEKPDILFLHSTFAGVIGRLASIGYKCKVIYNPHGWSFKMKITFSKKIIYAFIEFFLSFLTDKLIVISKSEYSAARKLGISPSKLEIVYNGIDTVIKTTPMKLDIPNINDKYVIGMVGRISEQKNPLFFVDFANAVYKKYPNTFFIIVGSGELESIVKEKIHEYGLDENFLITGWVFNPEDYISLFDQAVLFSKWEGFGFAVAEYMLYKKPIIINDIDGMSEIITENIDGIKIRLNDLNSAVKKSNVIRNNKELSKKLGENAFNNVNSRFSIYDKIRKIESIFLDLVGKE